MKTSYAVYMGLSVFLVTAPQLIAQTSKPSFILRLAYKGSYVEDFRPQRRGGAPSKPKAYPRGIIGLHLGGGGDQESFDLDKIGVSLPVVGAAPDYCISVKSSDGRYWSLNPYRLSQDESASQSIETHSLVAENLKKEYKVEDIIMRAIATDKCSDDALGPLIPIIPPYASDQSQLVVYINAGGDRSKVWLVDHAGMQLVSGQCIHDNSGDTNVYTEKCVIRLDGDIRQSTEKLGVSMASIGKPLFFDLQLRR